MQNKHAAVAAAVVAAVVLLAWRAGVAPARPPVLPQPSALPAPPVSAASAAAAARTPAPLVPAWADGDPDGLLALNDNRRLVVDLALRHRFDWLLSADASIGRDVLRARLRQDARQGGFSSEAESELLMLFDRYLDYLAATGGLDPGDRSPQQLRDVLERRRALRRSVLGVEAADAFFAADEARDAYWLESMTIHGDASLDAATRAARLADLRASAPADLRQVEEDRAALSALATLAQASPEQRLALRAQVVGAEAAQRLAALDEEEAVWAQRIEEARDEQRSIAAAALSEKDRQRALLGMIDRLFAGPERIRARALLGIDEP